MDRGVSGRCYLRGLRSAALNNERTNTSALACNCNRSIKLGGAFYTAAKAIGGKSWEKTGQIWYKALTGFAPRPNMTMRAFANRTRQLATQMYPGDAPVANAINAGWVAVGL